MKRSRLCLISLLLAGMTVSDLAAADPGHRRHGHFHGHPRFGVFMGMGSPLLFPWEEWPSPYYVPPPPPLAYVEKADPPSAQAGYWYRCDNPPGYFPDLRSCPAGWRQIEPGSAPY